MTNECSWQLADEAATLAFGERFARALGRNGMVMYLHGELGTGKTTFARALLGAMAVRERVKSPTYTLIEGYDAQGRPAWHLDLYRIADPGELEWLGLDALSDPAAVVLVEWPERGRGALPAADVTLHLAYAGDGRSARLQAHTPRGGELLAELR